MTEARSRYAYAINLEYFSHSPDPRVVKENCMHSHERGVN